MVWWKTLHIDLKYNLEHHRDQDEKISFFGFIKMSQSLNVAIDIIELMSPSKGTYLYHCKQYYNKYGQRNLQITYDINTTGFFISEFHKGWKTSRFSLGIYKRIERSRIHNKIIFNFIHIHMFYIMSNLECYIKTG